MTKEQRSTFLQSVKRSHWDPIVGVKMFQRRHPDVELTPDDYGYAVGVGRIAFPSIKGLPEGPFPVYKDRPFYDYRLWNDPEQCKWELEMALINESL